MVIIHDEVEYEMNKLVLLKDIKKEIRKLQDEGIEVGGESYAEIARLNDKINMLSAIIREKNEEIYKLQHYYK